MFGKTRTQQRRREKGNSLGKGAGRSKRWVLSWRLKERRLIEDCGERDEQG